MHDDVGDNSDRVLGHVAIPEGGRLNNVWGEAHLVVAPQNWNMVDMYTMQGYLCELGDWDQAMTIDDLWDAVVPKDADIGVGAGTEQLDMERASTNTEPADEIGEVSPIKLFQVQSPVEKVFQRRKLLSFASSPVGFIDTTTDSFYPTDGFPIRLSKRYAVRTNSYLLFGASNPAIVTSGTVPQVVNDEEWYMLMYMEWILEMAWPQVVGLTEAGAESPFGDVTTFLERIVEPVVYEGVGGRFGSSSHAWTVALTYDISVPGKPRFSQISG